MILYSDKKIIFMVGSLASGKGTQAKLLAEETGFYHFITSKEGKDYINAHRRDDPKTLKQEKLYSKGELWDPEWLVNQVQKEGVKKYLEEEHGGVIFDGSPRTLYEAENLLKITSDLVGKDNNLVIELKVSDEEVTRRTGERLVCDQDERHYISMRFGDYKIGDKCEKCGGILVKRDLDKLLNERLDEYKTRTVPAIEYLKKHYRVIEIDGEQSIEKIHKDIMDETKSWLQ